MTEPTTVAEARQQDNSALYVRLRDAISEHIEREAKRHGEYHGDPAATPGGTGYCIPAAVATQIVDKYLLAALPPSTPPARPMKRVPMSDEGRANMDARLAAEPHPVDRIAWPSTPHDINCGIDALRLGEDIGCTCHARLQEQDR